MCVWGGPDFDRKIIPRSNKIPIFKLFYQILVQNVYKKKTFNLAIDFYNAATIVKKNKDFFT